MEDKSYEVRYMSLDITGHIWIVRTKEFYFKSEAIDFAKRIAAETKKKTSVFEKIVDYNRIY